MKSNVINTRTDRQSSISANSWAFQVSSRRIALSLQKETFVISVFLGHLIRCRIAHHADLFSSQIMLIEALHRQSLHVSVPYLSSSRGTSLEGSLRVLALDIACASVGCRVHAGITSVPTCICCCTDSDILIYD
jgi:hypothetical protein